MKKQINDISNNKMKEKQINTEQLIKHWINTSNNDYQAMLDMYKTKHYHWSLFLGHLVIEKLLKAVYIKNKEKFPPLIHDLRRIIEKTEIVLTDEQIVIFDTISRFNINARYDDYKQKFYKLCTKEFTTKWINEIKDIRAWIKNTLLK